MASITVNGNTIQPTGETGESGTAEAWTLSSSSNDAPVAAASDASGSNFILVQADHALSPDEKQVLSDKDVSIQEYVAENTYLCRYEPADLQTLRSLPFVRNADVYHAELKTTISLKDMVERQADRTHYEVDLILHENPNVAPAELASYISEVTGVSVDDQEILDRKIRLTVHQDKLPELAALDSINRIEEVREYDVYNDQARAVLLGTTDTITGKSLPAEFQGAGQVVCVADTGFDQGVAADTAEIKVHPAFAGRIESIIGMVPDVSPKDPIGHGTHVCASVCGSGVYKDTTDQKRDIPIQGTAPSAKLVVQGMSKWSTDLRKWIMKVPADTATLYSGAYDLSVRIHSNSFGKRWSTTVGQLGYEVDATSIDRFTCSHLDFCILVAAGNDANKANAKQSQIGDNGAAKNCITVGATGTTRDNDGEIYKRGVKDGKGSNASTVAVFSSRGPTLSTRGANDQALIGRIKPEVVAPGVAILSAASRLLAADDKMRFQCGASDDPDWMFQSGTSMATPLVAGCVALLREALQGAGKRNPSAALIKALLINGAVRGQQGNAAAAVAAGPGAPVFDYEQGFGRVNVHASIAMIQQLSFVDGCGDKLGDQTAQDAACLRIDKESDRTWESAPLTLPGGGRNRLAVTLTYPDPHSHLLQNDVNLVVRAGGVERHGNMVGDDQGFDKTNNTEKIIWEDVPGPTATIVVRAQAFTLTATEQSFAVAWDIRSI